MGTKKSKEWYAAALRGISITRPDGTVEKVNKGLRFYANGFAAADGYDLAKFNEWTPAMKAQVSRYFGVVEELNTRTNYLFRGRNAEHLKIAQAVGQHPPKTPKLKVAFVPYTPPIKADRTKDMTPPKLHFGAGTMVIETRGAYKRFAPFNPEKLVRNPNQHIYDTVKSLGRDVSHFTIQAGLHQITSGAHGIQSGFEGVQRTVLALMAKYDGKKQLTGKKKKDDPKDHDYRDWLHGIVGYKFKPGSGGINKLGRDMEENKRRLGKLNRAGRRKMRHK